MVRNLQSLTVKLHPKQREAYTSKARIICFVGGLQSGKSTVGGLWMYRKTALQDIEGTNYLITSPTYKHLSQSIRPWVQSLFKNSGVYNKGDEVYHLNGGSHMWLRSLTDPTSIEGIPSVSAIWADEAGMISYNAWMALLGRSAFAKAPIFISSTPYSQNWLYRDLYVPWLKGLLPDVDIIQCKSIDNPFFPKDEYERQKTLMDARIFRMKYDAVFEKLSGLVYLDWDDVLNGWESCVLPLDRYQFFAGVDIGFADPFVVIVAAVARDGSHIILCDEFYRSFTSIHDKVSVLKQLNDKWSLTMIYCDGAHPESIEAFCSAGLNAVASKKGPGSVQHGISIVTSLIRDRTLRLMAGKCNNFVDEISTYSYREVDDVNKTTEEPLKMNDHAMDASRYLLSSIHDHYLTISHNEFEPTVTHLQRVLNGDYDNKDNNDWYNY